MIQVVNTSNVSNETGKSIQRKNFACEKGHCPAPDLKGRLPGTAALMPMLEGESPDECWDRFYRIWEPDLDRDGLLRKRALPATPASGVNSKRSRGSADEEPPPFQTKFRCRSHNGSRIIWPIISKMKYPRSSDLKRCCKTAVSEQIPSIDSKNNTKEEWNNSNDTDNIRGNSITQSINDW